MRIEDGELLSSFNATAQGRIGGLLVLATANAAPDALFANGFE